MSSKSTVARSMSTSGDMRTYIANCMLAVGQGEMKVTEAMAIKGLGDTLNDSLYSEIKVAALQVAMGRVAPALGDLPLGAKTDGALLSSK